MAKGAAARRYARALFQLASEEGRVAPVRESLAGFDALMAENANLRDVLLQPLHPVAERLAVLGGITEQAGSDPILRNFYAFLIDQRRLVEFDAIRAEYERLADDEAGITKAEVRSASALDDQQVQRLRAALGARTGRQIDLAVAVDPSLLGGIVATVGDVVYDGSLRTQLSQLRATLTHD